MASNSSIFTVDLESYRDRVAIASATMKGLYWGAQTDCSSDLGFQPITISRVLRGIEINDELLTKIEMWILGVRAQSPQPLIPQTNVA